MRCPVGGLLAVVLLFGGIAPVAAQGFSEVDSVVWIEGTLDEPDSPYVEAIVFVGNGGKTGLHHDRVNCNLFLIEHKPPKTKISAFCEVGKKARGAKAFLDVRVRNADHEFVAGCRSAIRKLRQYSRFTCTYEEPAAGSDAAGEGALGDGVQRDAATEAQP